MVRPASFGFNTETAASNHYQQAAAATANVQQQALAEFDAFVALLQQHDIPVKVWHDDTSAIRPDAIFPNNWFSTHPNGSLALYPMEAPNRRAERRHDIISWLQTDFKYHTVYNLTTHERAGRYLEGTGSVLFDFANGLAWASFSSRTHADVLIELCEKLCLLPVVFKAVDANNRPVYHTNVIMALHPALAIICTDATADAADKTTVERMLQKTGRQLLRITHEQVTAFAGNALFVKNRAGKDFVVISKTGWMALSPAQQEQLAKVATPLTPDIRTIEQTGGGSARCMLAEIYPC
ncbi:MAG: amidinotransferase [Bacteroidetes bacterium]|nr:amidinotransferase [Bacteroidota bacterium]